MPSANHVHGGTRAISALVGGVSQRHLPAVLDPRKAIDQHHQVPLGLSSWVGAHGGADCARVFAYEVLSQATPTANRSPD